MHTLRRSHTLCAGAHEANAARRAPTGMIEKN